MTDKPENSGSSDLAWALVIGAVIGASAYLISTGHGVWVALLAMFLFL